MPTCPKSTKEEEERAEGKGCVDGDGELGEERERERREKGN